MNAAVITKAAWNCRRNRTDIGTRIVASSPPDRYGRVNFPKRSKGKFVSRSHNRFFYVCHFEGRRTEKSTSIGIQGVNLRDISTPLRYAQYDRKRFSFRQVCHFDGRRTEKSL